jgi:anti-anti-sigma factor
MDSLQSPAAGGNTPFKISSENRSSCVVIKLCGSCNMVEASRLGEELLRATSKQPRLILLDMSELDFITSDGLGSIVAGYLRCRKYKGDIRLIGPPSGIRQLLELTRLTNLFEIRPSVEEGLRD